MKMLDKEIEGFIKGLLNNLIKDEVIDKLIEAIDMLIEKQFGAAKAQEDDSYATKKNLIDKSEQLAKISKRREELKEKLEGGQLKVDEASNIGIEYRILKKAYEDLLDGLKINL